MDEGATSVQSERQKARLKREEAKTRREEVKRRQEMGDETVTSMEQ